MYFVKESNKHALSITITKLGKVSFFAMLHYRYANATQVLLCKSNQQLCKYIGEHEK